jgi:alpha-tubulin suppressor-like RCC1 family protein
MKAIKGCIVFILVLMCFSFMAACSSSNTQSRMDRPEFLDAVIPDQFPEGFSMVSAGGNHNMLLSNDGKLWSWGTNGAGRLGDGTSILRRSPVEVINIENVISVSAGYDRTIAITADGSLWGWGADDNGFLGIGSELPRLINNAEPVFIMGNAAKVSAGNQRTMAVTSNGELWGWGSNTGGRLGDGTEEDRTAPVFLMSDVAEVAVGQSHALVIRPDGGLYSWGLNTRGQLGINNPGVPDSEPRRVMDNVVYVSTNSNGEHTAVITSDGALWLWGKNTHGQIGDGTNEDRDTPVHIMDNVIAVSAGATHTAAITRDNQLWVWGGNEHGQVGDGTDSNSYVPVFIKDEVVFISAGGRHTVALTADGGVWTWGSNAAGQLGDGMSENISIPAKIN